MNGVLPPKRSMSDVSRQPRAQVSVPPRNGRPQSQSKPKPKYQPQHSPVALLTAEPELPLLEEPKPGKHLLGEPKKSRLKRFMWWFFGILIFVLIATAVGAYSWYVSALQPVSVNQTEKTRIHIVTGSSPSEIGTLLEDKRLIRSRLAFDVYTRLSGSRAQLQAGVYNLAASESTQEIVTHLVSGNTDDFSITFLPGATLAENRTVLIKAGFSSEEVDAALTRNYEHPLLAGKPASSDLEGYIYGETYSFASNATVDQILVRTFDEFYKVVEKNNLIAGFEAQGLTLYEGITLASIIQREVPGAQDQKQVAQIFLTRLEIGMQLGSDVTAYYGADKLGVSRSVAVDTPYNTRLHTGMPPGPIGTPGFTALQAVAAPAEGDFIYFLSGDDEVTYFARTDSEHEANIRDHCLVKCSIP